MKSLKLPKLIDKNLLEIYRKKAQIKNRMNILDKQLNDLYKELEELINYVEKAEAINFWYKGVPLRVLGSGTDIWVRTVTVNATASFIEIYRNRSDDRFFGLRIKHGDWPIDIFCGCYWKSREKAKKAGLEWLATGKMPKYNGDREIVKRPYF